jgi:transketolase
MTHDSIGLGEDGPTYQPIEHLASLRAIPHLCVIRPGDANEVVYAWRAAMRRTHGPTMLVLTRQKVPILDGLELAPAEGLLKGAYVLAKERGQVPHVVLIATGSEVHLAVESRRRLYDYGIDARVVSMPSWELFREQPKAYRDEVLPPRVKARLAIEAASPQGWCEWVGESGAVIGMTRFGASAPGEDNFEHFGFTAENVTEHARTLVGH